MKHLFILDDADTFEPHKDTSTLLIEEARARGHKVDTGNINEVNVKESLVLVRDLVVQDYDVVWVRKDPPINMAYIEHVQLLALAENETFFVNPPSEILKFLDKVSIFHFPHLTPDTIVTKDPAAAKAFAKGREKVVVKPLDGFSGKGVRIYKTGEDLELDRFVMVQEYLENVKDGDTRVHICGGEVIGALRRIPDESDFRGNIHAGGTAAKAELTPDMVALAEEVGAFLKERGIFFAGIDLIDGKLSEINITSPGVIIETNEVSGERLEKKIFDILEQHVRV